MQVHAAPKELDYLVRALSHDMTANFMLLEDSFRRLKRSLDGGGQRRPPEPLGEQVAHVEACLRQSRRFLDDLVSLARTGRVEMEPGPVGVSAVVEEVLFEQRDLLARRGIQVDVRGPLPAVWCHAGRLKQVVTNLVRNAAQHGCNPQRPRITISPCGPGAAGSGGPDGRMAGFRVHDNGPGIDPRFQHEVFLPGRRLPGADSQGSGMGLAIVRRIVEHYLGSVHIDGDCRTGTAVVVVLPEAASRRRASADSAGSRRSRPQRQSGHRRLQLDGRHRPGPRRRGASLSSQPPRPD